MMEPVAYLTTTKWSGHVVSATIDLPSLTFPDRYDVEPLVRLSDAEARIAELEAKLAEADALIEAQQHDFAQNNIRNAENAHRAEAAEALLKEARPHEPTAEMLAAAMKADQDGMPASMKTIWMVMWGAYKPARAISDKIGVKDENR